MAKGNLAQCLATTLEFEGGYSNHPKDPGGATNRGVTQAVYDAWRRARNKSRQSVKLITESEVESIYEMRYWRFVRGDSLPRGADLVTFDYAVNSGVGRASRHAQAIVGVLVDGVIGSVTAAAIVRFDTRSYIKKLCAKRLGFVQSLKIWNTFGKGWSRRIAAMEATALSWVSTRAQMEADAKVAGRKGTVQAGGAAGAGGTIVASGGADTVQPGFDFLFGLPLWAFVLLVFLLALPFVVRSAVNLQRADALAAAAKRM